MTKRRQAREFVLKVLYAYEIFNRDVNEIIEEVQKESSIPAGQISFIHFYVGETIKNLNSLDKEIERLAENWKLDRIAVIDRIILRMGLCELHFMPDIPEKVAINEAVDLAKKYSTSDSSSFVNGILDAALTEIKQ
ncbi:MAG: transcription antitermination factor NusB [candidate division Zixibacteria bacterium]